MAKRSSSSALVDLTGGSSDESDNDVLFVGRHGAMPPAKRRRRGKFDKKALPRNRNFGDDTASDADDSDVELVENSAHNSRRGRPKDDRKYDSEDDTKSLDKDEQSKSDRAFALALALEDDDEDRTRRQAGQ